MRIVTFVLMGICVSVIDCNRGDPKREKIVFEDDFQSVTDTMAVMVQIMDKLKNIKGIDNYGFSLDGDFGIGGQNIGNVANILSDTFKLLEGMSKETKNQFISIVMFLRRNFMSGCSYDGAMNRWYFSYRDIPIINRDDNRLLILLKEGDKAEHYEKFVRILDRKGNVILSKDRFD